MISNFPIGIDKRVAQLSRQWTGIIIPVAYNLFVKNRGQKHYCGKLIRRVSRRYCVLCKFVYFTYLIALQLLGPPIFIDAVGGGHRWWTLAYQSLGLDVCWK